MLPINLTKFKTSLSAASIRTLPTVPVHALYVHVPFCQRKCAYCDFYSHAGSEPQRMADYTRAVAREAEIWASYAANNAVFRTVFFGGGTPTSLPPDLMRELLLALRDRLPIAPDAEWTIEANPATIDSDYCDMLLNCGVNRLSLGAQSLVDSELKTLGRIHDAQEVHQSVKTAVAAGFNRVSIDLMYAVPGQTLDTWEYSLSQAVDLGISHISCYCLTLEEGTPMWQQAHRGAVKVVDEQAQISFMQFTLQYLSSRGMMAYEISNYATPGEECRHNIAYWRSENYLGLGPAAASHLAGRRWRNIPDTNSYITDVLNHTVLPIVDQEIVSPQARADELIMLMLRMKNGLEWQRLIEVAGDIRAMARVRARIPHLRSLGLIAESATGIQLTDRGVLVADEVIGELVREPN